MAIFEDVFSEAQMEMVAAGLDYAAGQADNIYIYFSTLGGMLYAHAFFSRDGHVLLTHQLPGVDTSVTQQQVLLDACLRELKNLQEAGVAYNREAPVEGYLHYKVGGALDARYSYEDIPVGEDPQWDKKLETWMKSVQEELDGKATQR